MALGQYVAGMGFSNVGLGLVHAMAHPLGAFYDTPHGVANGVLLPHVMAFNAASTGEKLRDVARALGVHGVDDMPLTEARAAAISAVANLARALNIPRSLRDGNVRATVSSASSKRISPNSPRQPWPTCVRAETPARPPTKTFSRSTPRSSDRRDTLLSPRCPFGVGTRSRRRAYDEFGSQDHLLVVVLPGGA